MSLCQDGRGLDAIRRRCNQLKEYDGSDPGIDKWLQRPIRLRDLADGGRSAAKTFLHAAPHCVVGDVGGIAAEADDLADPIDKPHAPATQRLGQVAELQVRVGIDQPREDGDVAQVLDRGARRRLAHGHDPPRLDGHGAVGERIAGDREDPSGLECEGVGG